ncbi:MAG TPA: MerR family transcriptional regulator [Acidobacteriota bacterium]|nr:MerR family transcriptional regulator [Acidobacteriota bacterium]
MNPLSINKDQHYIGTSDLAAAAARQIRELVPEQVRGSVTEIPDERMVRYYISQRVLPEPLGKNGNSSVYGYRHLLVLLVVKRLQAEFLPLAKIRSIIAESSIEDLERILTPNPSKENTQVFLESLLKAPTSQPGSSPARAKLWQRHEIEPGFEIQVRQDWVMPSDAESQLKLAQKILRKLSAELDLPKALRKD